MSPGDPERDIVGKGDEALPQVEQFGAKAAGLAGLDAKWTPGFVAVRAGAYSTLREGASKPLLVAALHQLGPLDGGVIVRSSAVGEVLRSRGSFDSARAAADVDGVVESMASIAARTSAEHRGSLGFIVQEWVEGAATGHLSNERRVSQEARSWLCEAELPIEAEDRTFRFRVDSSAPGRDDLRCATWEELAAAIRSVGRGMQSRGGRYHLEWVWDGDRLWIVQCDRDDVPVCPAPGSSWLAEHVPQPLGDLRLFKRVTSDSTPFPKVNQVGVFKRCGLPAGDLRALSGATVIQHLAEGRVSRDLRRDLETLIKAPVVVRTDARAATEHPEILSKRTDTCRSYAQLERFLIDTAREAIDLGKAARDLAFLAHRFLVARAGAMSYGQPGSSRIRIDATWGIPDSLLFHPHDSFRVDIGSGGVERYLRCKTDYIDVSEDGSWKSRPAGRAWDWRPALTNSEMIEIGEITARLADHTGTDIEVMFFVGSAEGPNVLPWFFTQTQADLAEVQAARGYFVGERVSITTLQDLRALDEDLRQRAGGRRVSISLRPAIELLRSRDFILQVAEVAKRWRLPVELEGSQLSHAYYLLEEAGAATRCVNPWRQPERRRSFGKLVRDLVPVRIERRGELATTYSAERGQLRDLIKAKMVEEALEYYWADTDADIEEMADLLELLQTAARVHGIEFSAIVEAARAKRSERGGFEGGVVLVETRDADRAYRRGNQGRPLTNLPVGASPRRRPLPTRRVVRLPGGRLVLPLAPPTGWRSGEGRIVSLTADDNLRISYGSSEILLQVRPRETGENADQLALFDSDVPLGA